MKTFIDCKGEAWDVVLNVAQVKRVKDLAKVDLLDVADGKLFEQLVDNPMDLVNVLFVVCRDQAATRGVTDEAFGERMGGDALDGGSMVLLEELVDFFPKRRRPLLAKALEKLRKLEAKLLETASKMLDDPQIDQAMDAAMADLGRSFTNAPLSPESTPTLLPFAS